MAGIVEIRGGPASVFIDTVRGGDVTHYRDARIDGDVFWSRWDDEPLDESAAEISTNTQSFYDNYRGGMQELFPNTADSAVVLGAQLPFHGELCRTACAVLEQSADSVTLRAELKRYPVVSTRTFRVANSGNLSVTSRFENLSKFELPYSWGFHPVFSEYFTGLGATLACSTSGAYSDPSPFSSKQAYPPNAKVRFEPSSAGDTLQLLPPDGASADLVYVELTENWFTLGRPGTHPVTMRWDNPDFSTLWLWQECKSSDAWPWWGLHHIVGVEPHTSHPAVSLKSHIDRSSHKLLSPLGIVEATFEFELGAMRPDRKKRGK